MSNPVTAMGPSRKVPSPRTAWLLPLAALLSCGAWIFQSHRANVSLNQEVSGLELRMKQAEQIATAQAQQREAEAKQEAQRRRIDWKKIGTMGKSDVQDVLLLHQIDTRVKAMSLEELIAELDAQEQADLTPRAREMMRIFLFNAIAAKDPKFACERFIDDFVNTNDNIRYRMPYSLGAWYQKDPAGATAWLDRMVQEGKLEGKSLELSHDRRAVMEGVVIGNLLTSDFAAAKARLSDLPDEMKAGVFSQMAITGNLTKESGANGIRLVREQLSGEQAAKAMMEITTSLIGRGADFTAIDQSIAGAGVTDAEKRTIVTDGLAYCINGTEWNFDALGKARDWAAMHQPEQVDEITGAAMVRAAQEYKTYDQAAKLALAYQEKSGNDAVLVSFLQHAAGDEGFASKAQGLIEKIKDPAQREAVGKLYAK